MAKTTPAAKLKAYLDEGKSYHEAAQALHKEGFSRLEISDAKIFLDSKKDDSPQPHLKLKNNTGAASFSQNPELAKDLTKVQTAGSKERPEKVPGYLFYANSIPLFNVKVKGNIYWLFILAILIFLGLFLFVYQNFN